MERERRDGAGTTRWSRELGNNCGMRRFRVQKIPTVYILASKRNGTLYIGVSSDLKGRVWLHKNGLADGFTNKYKVHLLVYFEAHPDMVSAITREKQMKKWRRAWKIALIEKTNPEWRDLWEDLF